jgi:conjugal transfer pilus assembly protein TraF
MPGKVNWGDLNTLFGACLFAILIGVCVPLAGAKAESSPWWMRGEQGWFFYKDPPQVEQEDPPEMRLPPPKPEEATPALPFVERMKRKGDQLLSNAMEKPDEANMLAYMRHNKAMLDTSNTFAQIWQRMLMKYPELFLDVSTQKTKEEIEKSIREIRDEAGLIFLYNESCPFSKREVPVLTEFKEKHGFDILPVTMDGGVFPEFPDTRLDNGISATLGVKTVPAIFIAFPDQGRIDLLSSSFISLIDLENKIYRYLVSEDLLKELPKGGELKEGNEREQRAEGGN